MRIAMLFLRVNISPMLSILFSMKILKNPFLLVFVMEYNLIYI